MPSWLIEAPRQLNVDGEVTHLDVWLAHGTLQVVAADGPARLDVRRVGRKGLAVSYEDGVLSVRHPVPRKGWRNWAGPVWWFGVGTRHYNAEVIIAVPPSAIAGLTVVSGTVVASGLREGATVDVTSGTVTLMGLGGVVVAKTISGAIEAMGVGGDLRMQTVSGEISLADSSAERVFARTISGAVTCDLDNPLARDVHLATTSGEIIVRVPTDANLDVSLNATSGRVRSDFPQVRNDRSPGVHSAHGRIGAGSGTLSASAVSGSVSLLARPTEHFAPPAPTVEDTPASDEARGEARP
jgi:hypothetical protein